MKISQNFSKGMRILDKQIISMLRENTGTHMMDSGGESNRHWQTNQRKQFIEEPKLSIEVYDKEVIYTQSLFHFLREHLSVTKESRQLQKQFMKFATKGEHETECWLASMEAFMEELGIKPNTTNSYNGESNLSQVIQYTTFEVNKTHYILLQIHNGCDVRGGYTAPHVFEMCEIEDWILDQTDIYAHCGCENWSSDDFGYHFYDESTCSAIIPNRWTFNKEEQQVTCSECNKPVEFNVRY